MDFSGTRGLSVAGRHPSEADAVGPLGPTGRGLKRGAHHDEQAARRPFVSRGTRSLQTPPLEEGGFEPLVPLMSVSATETGAKSGAGLVGGGKWIRTSAPSRDFRRAEYGHIERLETGAACSTDVSMEPRLPTPPPATSE
jgi:hypothetical protein